MEAINNIINRMKEKSPAYIEVFGGDDKKKEKPISKIFNLENNSIIEIINYSKKLNINNYGVFININPLSQPRRLKVNISKIFWVFIDLDNAVEDHNNIIKNSLDKWGFTYCYNAKSGHGYHFLIPIDLENNQEQFVKKFLIYLKENICDKVDIATYTNERLMRFPESLHNKDDDSKQLITIHTHYPTKEEIESNNKLLFKYQQEQKKGQKDIQYQNSIERQDIFFSTILNQNTKWHTYYKYLDNSEQRNNIFIKNLGIFCKKNPEYLKTATLFLNDWESARSLALAGWVKKSQQLNMKINYSELFTWVKQYKLKLWEELLTKQLNISFLDQYEIYYLEEEKRENSYLLYYPERNYFVQKSLQEVLQNIYYDSKEQGLDLVKEFNLDLIDDWDELSFKKQLATILSTIHKKLDTENRIKLVYNINYEPTDSKFVYFDNKKYFNTFVSTELIEYTNTQKDYNFPYIKELIMNLSGDDEKSYEYFIRWLAWIIQNPTQKLPTAIILQGQQGTGKGIFKTHILDNIFGSNVQEINQTHLESAFNSYLMGKQIIVANEVMHNENRQTLPNILKNLVTDPEITINRKFQKEIKGKNYTHWIFCTNSDNPIKIEEGDRRYSVFYSEKLKGGGKDAVKFVKSLQSNLDFELKEFVSYLKHIKVKYEDVHEPIMTNAKQSVMDLNKDSVERFFELLKSVDNLEDLFDKVYSNLYKFNIVNKDTGAYVPYETFYDLYKTWCLNTHESGIFNKQNFSRRLTLKGCKSETIREKGTFKAFDVKSIITNLMEA